MLARLTATSLLLAALAAPAAGAAPVPAVKVTKITGSVWSFGMVDVKLSTRCSGGANAYMLSIDGRYQGRYACGGTVKVKNGADGSGEHRATLTPVRTTDTGKRVASGRKVTKTFTAR